MMSTFRAVRDVRAPAALVWEVLLNFSPMTWGVHPENVEVEWPGVDFPNGVGAIRALRSWRGTVREETIEFEPERRLSYIVFAGVPTRFFRGVIELSAGDDVTRVTWRVNFLSRTFAAPIVALMIKLVLWDAVSSFVREVRSRAGPRVVTARS